MIQSGASLTKLERLKEFGAQLAIDTTQADWPQQVLDATGGQGVHLIVDQLSGAHMAE